LEEEKRVGPLKPIRGGENLATYVRASPVTEKNKHVVYSRGGKPR